jgi:hypothetical protein
VETKRNGLKYQPVQPTQLATKQKDGKTLQRSGLTRYFVASLYRFRFRFRFVSFATVPSPSSSRVHEFQQNTFLTIVSRSTDGGTLVTSVHATL